METKQLKFRGFFLDGFVGKAVLIWLLIFSGLVFSQKQVNLNLSNQPSPYLNFRLSYSKAASAFDGQNFTFFCKNISDKTRKIDFDLIAFTICGREVSEHFTLRLDSGEEVGGGNFMDTQYLAVVTPSECKGEKISYTIDGKSYTGINRIKTLGIRNLKIDVFGKGVSKATDAPSSYSGSNDSNKPQQTMSNTTISANQSVNIQQPKTNDPTQQQRMQSLQQTQDYINQQNQQREQQTQAVTNGLQQIGNVFLESQNAKFQREMSSFKTRSQEYNDKKNRVWELSREKGNSAEQDYQKGIYNSALQNWIEQLYFKILENNQGTMVNSYVFKRDIPEYSTTGDYILFKSKIGSINNANNFKSIEIEKFILPDVFKIPICKVFNNKPVREYDYQQAFSFIKDCKACKSVYIELDNNSGYHSIDCKDGPSAYNIDSALSLMEKNISTAKINNTVDLLDYTTTFLWYNCLKLKNAQTVNDLLSILKTNMKYYEMFDLISKYSGSLKIYEHQYWEQANTIGNYYTLMACGMLYDSVNARQKKNIGEIAKKITSISYNLLGNSKYESNSNDQIKTLSEVASLLSDLNVSN